MIWHFLLFVVVILAVLGGGSAYMGLRTIALCPSLGLHGAWVWGSLGMAILLFIMAPILQRIPWVGAKSGPMLWLGYSLFSLLTTYFVALLLVDVGQWLLGVLGWNVRAWAVPLALGLTCVACAWGALTALRAAPLREIEAPIAHLPPELDGFKIVHLSDLHISPMMRARALDHVVQLTLAQAPDLIAITGDLADGKPHELRAL